MGSAFSPMLKAAHLPARLLGGFPQRQDSRRNQCSRQTYAAGRLGRGGMGSTAHPKGPGWRSSATAPDARADSQPRGSVTVTYTGDGFLHVTANPTALEGLGHMWGRDGLPVPHLSPLRACRERTHWG